MNKHQQMAAAWVTRLRPRFEGCNVGTWIGFKHVMYLAEEAVVQYFRENAIAPGRLLSEYGASLEIVQTRLRLVHGTRVDDEVEVRLLPVSDKGDGLLSFKLELALAMHPETKLANGQISVQLCEAQRGRQGAKPLPTELERLLQPSIGCQQAPDCLSVGENASEADIRAMLAGHAPSAFVWRWRVPYFYCHDTYRLQHSGYVRLLEEVVDRFLEDRGISIRTMLDEKSWIPVVTAANVHVLAETRLEETLYVVFCIEDIMQQVAYSANVDHYVHRGGQLLRVATSKITHAYVEIEDRSVGTKIARFDERTLRALGAATGEERGT